MKKNIIFLFFLLAITARLFSQQMNTEEQVYLLVRGDDIGSSHAANMACIESYKNGIVRSVELMPPCPWFPEAVKMLKENPGLDVGIHLVLTSEWSNMKWRPLTTAPSIADKDGYFYPMVWKNANFPANSSLEEADWKIDEIEKELRAQIELAIKHIPYVTHAGTHMSASKLDPKIKEVLDRLLAEYDLKISLESHTVQRFEGWGDAGSLDERIRNFTDNLEKLESGIYLFIDHPAMNTPEMKAIHHTGYDNVAEDRDWVTKVFTSEEVMRIIKEEKINLISYKDLKDSE